MEYTDRYKYQEPLGGSDRDFAVEEVFRAATRKFREHDEDEGSLQPRNEGGDGEHIITSSPSLAI